MTQTIQIIEIIGLPGSGKTTLINALQKKNNNIIIKTYPYYRRLKDIPFYLRNLFLLLPTLLRLKFDRQIGWLSPRDLVSMVIVNGWHHDLKKAASNGNVIILDEGGIEILNWLRTSGSKYLKSHYLESWWNIMYETWAQTINLLVYLDAPLPLLLERVRTRDNGWITFTDDGVLDYLKDLQEPVEETRLILTSKNRRLKTMRFSTVTESIESIRDKIMEIINHPGESI